MNLLSSLTCGVRIIACYKVNQLAFVLNHILYFQDVLFFWNLFFAFLLTVGWSCLLLVNSSISLLIKTEYSE